VKGYSQRGRRSKNGVLRAVGGPVCLACLTDGSEGCSRRRNGRWRGSGGEDSCGKRRALTCDEDQNALESFRLDKAVEEAQESDEDASTSRAATPCQNGTEWGVIITDALQEAEFDGEEARLGALICSGLG